MTLFFACAALSATMWATRKTAARYVTVPAAAMIILYNLLINLL